MTMNDFRKGIRMAMDNCPLANMGKYRYLRALLELANRCQTVEEFESAFRVFSYTTNIEFKPQPQAVYQIAGRS